MCPRARSDHLFAAKCSESFNALNFELVDYQVFTSSFPPPFFSESFAALNFQESNYPKEIGASFPHPFLGVAPCNLPRNFSQSLAPPYFGKRGGHSLAGKSCTLRPAHEKARRLPPCRASFF